MLKVLLIGSHGYLGSFITKYSKDYPYEFTFTGRSAENLFNSPNYLVCDLLDPNSLATCLDKSNPDIIINCAAQALPDDAEKDKDYAYNANVTTTRNLVKESSKRKIKLIHLSTDYVFSGEKGNYKEMDETGPINHYGKTKLEAEQIIIGSDLKYLILRTSVLYGLRFSHQRLNLFHSIYEPLSKSQIISLPTDQVGCPTSVDDMAKSVLEFVKSSEQGIFHCCGPDMISRYEFGTNLAEIFGFDSKLITPIENKKQMAKRPKDSSMNADKFNSILEFRFNNVRNGLINIKKQIEANGGKILFEY
jgi:dTDP-4-dehydrorhamnose reductase